MKIEFSDLGPSGTVTLTSLFYESRAHNYSVLQASQLAPGLIIRTRGFWCRKTTISGRRQDLRKVYMVMYLLER